MGHGWLLAISDATNINILAKAEKEGENPDISDEAKYLVNHKIEVLKSLTLN